MDDADLVGLVLAVVVAVVTFFLIRQVYVELKHAIANRVVACWFDDTIVVLALIAAFLAFDGYFWYSFFTS